MSDYVYLPLGEEAFCSPQDFSWQENATVHVIVPGIQSIVTCYVWSCRVVLFRFVLCRGVLSHSTLCLVLRSLAFRFGTLRYVVWPSFYVSLPFSMPLNNIFFVFSYS